MELPLAATQDAKANEHLLLSDTEIAEDVIKDILGVNGSRDGAEVMQGLPDVTSHQVSRNIIAES